MIAMVRQVSRSNCGANGMRDEEVFVLLLFYGIATVCQLYLGHDMMNEMTMRKPEPTILLTQGIINIQHHIGMVLEELAFGNTVSYAQWGNRFRLQHS